MDIPLESIELPAHAQEDPAAIAKMVRTLQTEGLPKPILVRALGDRYVILDGVRRYQAAKQLGWETIAVRIKGQPRAPIDPLTTEIAQSLNEPNVMLVDRVVKGLGAERAHAFWQQALEIEANGGLMTADGQRRRTPGGVFFQLVRKGVSKKERKAIFPYVPQRKPPGSATPPQQQAQPDMEPIAWSDALKYVHALGKHEKGRAKTVEVKLIGRPAKVAKAESCMVAVMEGKESPKSLPKGLPTPPEQELTFAVFISNKHWAKVSPELKSNANAELMVRGYPVFNAEKATTFLLAQSVEVIERKPKKAKEAAA